MSAVARVAIAPLSLVHLFQRPPFMTPVNAWNLVSARAESLGLERIVTPLSQWIWAQTTTQAEAIEALLSVDLGDLTIQARQDLKDKLITPSPPSPIHAPVQFLPQPPLTTSAPPPSKLAIVSEDWWGDDMCTLLSLCNVTAATDLPPIWDAISPLSKYRDQSAMEAACCRTSEHLLGLSFYSKYPEGLGKAINILLLPNLSPSEVSEDALL